MATPGIEGWFMQLFSVIFFILVADDQFNDAETVLSDAEKELIREELKKVKSVIWNVIWNVFLLDGEWDQHAASIVGGTSEACGLAKT